MLPEGFRFSQGSLQDFVDCPRRFQLKYLVGQIWPAVVAEPVAEVERALERGARFHRMVERDQLGVRPELLQEGLGEDEELALWWRNYLGYRFLHDLVGERYPELALAACVDGVRVVAALDLVVVEPGQRVVVFDWKTYSRLPERRWLSARLQTRVYRWLLAECGRELFGDWVEPGVIWLVYWVVGVDGGVEFVFRYSAEQFEEDSVYLQGLVGRVRRFLEEFGEGVWPLAVDSWRCKVCEYRSFCDRGVESGNVTGKEGNSMLLGLSLLDVGGEVLGF